jgi:hypothetical protein
MREEGILTAIQRNAIRSLRKIPNARVTLMSGTAFGGWGVVVYSDLQKRYEYCFLDFHVIAENVFCKVEGDCW